MIYNLQNAYASVHTMNIIRHPVEHYLNLLHTRVPFTFNRWCDGEMRVLFPRGRVNCDGNSYTLPGIRDGLMNILTHQYPYYHGCLLNERTSVQTRFLAYVEKTCPVMPWYDADIFHQLSYTGRIAELMQALMLQPTCIVGPQYLTALRHLYDYTDTVFVTTPLVDAYTDSVSIRAAILEYARVGIRTFVFSAGFAAKIWIDELWPVLGQSITLLDMGSIWDPYCNRFSREESRRNGRDFFQSFTTFPLS